MTPILELLRRRLGAAVLACAAVLCQACGTTNPDTTVGEPAAPVVRLDATDLSSAPARTSAPQSGPPPTSMTTAPDSTVDRDQPVLDVAAAWLTAYRQAAYTEPADAWIARITPLVTADLAQKYAQLRAAGREAGVARQDFVERRCIAVVHDAAAVIPPEAPRTTDVVHVQASAVLVTACTAGRDPPAEELAVTLTAVHTDAGWRIASREP